MRQPTIFLDLIAAPKATAAPQGIHLPSREAVEGVLLERDLQAFAEGVAKEHAGEIEVISRHLEISLNAIIDRVQVQFAELAA